MKVLIYGVLLFAAMVGAAHAQAYADTEVTDPGGAYVTVSNYYEGTSGQNTVYFLDANGVPIRIVIKWYGAGGSHQWDDVNYFIPYGCVKVTSVLTIEDTQTYTSARDRDSVDLF